MSDEPARQLLLECRERLLRVGGILLHRSTLQRIDGYLRTAAILIRPGDRVIERARLDADRFERVAIDADEIETRVHPSGIQVRAWFLVPHDTMTLLTVPHVDDSGAYGWLPPLTREIVALRVRTGLSVEEIAYRQSIPVWRVRRHLRRGLKRITQALRDER
ncbi:MAG: sigma factor-like helix-turn-helix DNA-binding protein [Sphingobium limneticum]